MISLNYFGDDEFKCRCGCGLDVRDSTKRKFDSARLHAGVSFNLTSGARCQEHNKNIGSKKTSSHTPRVIDDEEVEPSASDIGFSNNHEKFLIIVGLLSAGFVRIGINDKKKFVHADDDEHKPQETMFPY